VLGQGVWLAKTPNKASNADALKKFLTALRNLGARGDRTAQAATRPGASTST